MDPRLIQHKELAAGRWRDMDFFAQMGNIGSEVSRARRWKEKDRPDRMLPAFERCLELLDLTVAPLTGPRRRELLRMREVLCDFFLGDNLYHSTGESLQRYFDDFALALRM